LPSDTTALISVSTTFVLLAEVLHFRALPFLGYALLTRAYGLRTRAASGAMLLGATWLCLAMGTPLERLIAGSCAQLYIVLLAPLVHRSADLFSAGRITKPAAFGGMAALFLVVPAVLLPPVLSMPFLTLGWEAMLAATSYTLEGRTERARPTLRDCVFFLVVDPTLVYVARGSRLDEGGLDRRALGRIALGIGAMACAIALALLGARAVLDVLSGAPAYALFVAHGVYFFVGRYAALSGLASVQLGAMRLLGYRVPERYRYPFLATSPSDFWQRWNTYVGGWFQRYMLVPLALELRARAPFAGKHGATLSAIATLLAIGAFHDFFTYLGALRAAFGGIAGFSCAALAMVTWMLAGSLWRKLSAHLAISNHAAEPKLVAFISRLATVHVAFMMAWAMVF
jgi:hypothetical protein